MLKVNPSDCSLLLSESPLHPTSIQDTLDEMLFEHFGFDSYCTHMRTQPLDSRKFLCTVSGAASSAFAPPPAAGDLRYAQFWYYIDDSGESQGLFSTAHMRAWYQNGFFLIIPTISMTCLTTFTICKSLTCYELI